MNEVDACAHYEGCVITNNFSAVEYAELYCDGEIMRNNIQSAYFFGCLLGITIVIGMSGQIGRKLAFILIVICQIVGACLILIGVYNKIWIFCIIGQFLSGFFMSPATSITYIATG